MAIIFQKSTSLVQTIFLSLMTLAGLVSLLFINTPKTAQGSIFTADIANAQCTPGSCTQDSCGCGSDGGCTSGTSGCACDCNCNGGCGCANGPL